MQPMEIARELEQRGVTLEDVPSDTCEFLCPFDPGRERRLYEWARGSGSAGFRLVGQDVDLLYVVGFGKERLTGNSWSGIVPGVQARYVVTEVEASLALDAEGSRVRRGFLGLGGKSRFRWRLGRRGRSAGMRRDLDAGHLATWLNEDTALNDMLSAGEYGCIYVDPDPGNDCLAIRTRDPVASAAQVADFLAPANIIARRARILARWGGL
jgi:hypothetical protein